MRYTLLLLCILAAPAKAWDGWQLAANTALGADWLQTQYIANHPARFEESGPAARELGPHPTSGEVNRYFLESAIVMNVIGYLLPEGATIGSLTFNPRKVFYIGYTAYETRYVVHNAQIGIRFDY